MAMKPIGYTPPERYRRIPYRERIMAELVRRIESKDWAFATVVWKRVGREPLSDLYGGSLPGGEALALVDGLEQLSNNAHSSENVFEIEVEFCVYPGEDERPLTVLNIVMAELVEVLCRQHALEEGGVGTGGEVLSCSIFPRTYSPVPPTPRENRARAILTLEVKYRTRHNNYFEPKP